MSPIEIRMRAFDIRADRSLNGRKKTSVVGPFEMPSTGRCDSDGRARHKAIQGRASKRTPWRMCVNVGQSEMCGEFSAPSTTPRQIYTVPISQIGGQPMASESFAVSEAGITTPYDERGLLPVRFPGVGTPRSWGWTSRRRAPEGPPLDRVPDQHRPIRRAWFDDG